MNARPLITTEEFAAIVYPMPKLLPARTQTALEAEIATRAATFPNLSKVKRGIIQQAYRWGSVADRTYTKEKQSLWQGGWLQHYRDAAGNVNTSKWMLTPGGRKAYEKAQFDASPAARTDGLRVADAAGVVHKGVTDDTLADAMRNAYPARNGVGYPAQTVVLDLSKPPLPFDEPDATHVDLILAARIPERLFTAAWYKDWCGWVVPVRGDEQMWDVLLPVLRTQSQYLGFAADKYGWDVYARSEVDARELARLVCSFDPFVGMVAVDCDDGRGDTVRPGDREYRGE
jgi:hypothetical protein